MTETESNESDVAVAATSETETVADAEATQRARWIVESALEVKAERPVVLDMRQLTAYADTFVVLSGRSDRQVRSIADAILHGLKKRGELPLGIEGMDDGNWVLIDCNDAIVHVFDLETREQFDLERLWRDAPRLDLGIPELAATNEVGTDSEAEQDGDEQPDP